MRYLTSGESHGPQLTVIIEGVPANLEIHAADINEEMFKRQGGYGRGRRMQIEKTVLKLYLGYVTDIRLVVQSRLLSQMMILNIGEKSWALILLAMKIKKT